MSIGPTWRDWPISEYSLSQNTYVYELGKSFMSVYVCTYKKACQTAVFGHTQLVNVLVRALGCKVVLEDATRHPNVCEV